MIVTSVIVLAIVGSSLAFEAKKVGAFCIDTNGSNKCDLIIQNFKRTIGTPMVHYFPNWDGDPANCINSNNCTSQSYFRFN